MSSFFQGEKDDPSAPTDPNAPVFTGATTREQATAPTGASTSPTASGQASAAAPASAPGSATPAASQGNAQAAGKAPAWTNLTTFLGAQDPTETASVTKDAVSKAATNATNTAQAGNSAAQGVKTDVAAGTHTGSVGPATGVFTPPPTPTSAASTPDSTAVGGAFRSTGLHTGINTHDAPAPTPRTAAPTTGPAGPAPVAPDVTTEPSYDLSHVNLAGYTGPDQSQVAGRFGAATNAATNAQTNANALGTGHVAANAYDNAIATSAPNWGKVLGAVGGENSAAEGALAQANGAGEQVTQGQGTSAANVATQKAKLGDAATNIASTATNNLATYKAVSDALSNPTADSLGSLVQDPKALAQVGLTSAELAPIVSGLQTGQLTAAQAKDMLANYASAAKTASGYTAEGATQANTINGLLKNGAAPVAATAGPGGTNSLDPTARENANKAAVKTLQDAETAYNSSDRSNWYDTLVPGKLGQDKRDPGILTTPQTAQAIQALLNSGYSAAQIASLTGIPADLVNTETQANP